MPDKYQSEIEEILKQSEDATPAGPAAKPVKPVQSAAGKPAPRRAPEDRGSDRNQPQPDRASGRFTISPGKLMLTGLVVLLIALLLRVSLGWVGMDTLGWVGMGIIAVAYLLLFIKPASTGGYEKRWRGQPLEKRGSAWKRFINWLRH
ncbi:MAG: hypothetical protein EXR54_06240 [Dehalococcoidia bacterium]|nr:hypothetical protein [Dehalococcoidia bacterium]